MNAPIVLERGVVIPGHEIEIETSRASGPGGQHVNKTETRVTLRFNVTTSPSIPEFERERMLRKLGPRLTKSGEVIVSSSKFRDRLRNIGDARERLAELLRQSMRLPRQRRKTKPTAASKKRRLVAKRTRSDVKKQRRRPPLDD